MNLSTKNADGSWTKGDEYYNPEWCRYLNTDAIAGRTELLLSHNVFSYAMNNPVNMVDPNGYLAENILDTQDDDEPYVDVITSAALTIPKPSSIIDLVKGTIGGIGDKGLEKLATKLPSHIPYYANRAAIRSRGYLVIPIESVKRIKGSTALGVIGLGMTVKSVWTNYHSGYGFGEATGRSGIDVGIAIFSIVAGAYTGGVGCVVVGTALSASGELIRNRIWGNR